MTKETFDQINLRWLSVDKEGVNNTRPEGLKAICGEFGVTVEQYYGALADAVHGIEVCILNH